MGKASSKKKMARAAKAGGGARARAAGDRNLLFPAALALVVILGTILVVYARNDRIGEEQTAPISGVDHWHSAYGIYICNEYVADMPQFTAPNNGGTHTHGDGVVHVHPFSESRAGNNATLTNFFEDAPGYELSDDELTIPGRDTLTNDSQCEGEDADSSIQVLFYPSAATALSGGDPIRITSDFDRLRFTNDKQVFVVVFGADDLVPDLPASVAALEEIGGDLSVSEVPEGLDFNNNGIDDRDETGNNDTTATTVVGDAETTDTTVADDEATTETTVADDAEG